MSKPGSIFYQYLKRQSGDKEPIVQNEVEPAKRVRTEKKSPFYRAYMASESSIYQGGKASVTDGRMNGITRNPQPVSGIMFKKPAFSSTPTTTTLESNNSFNARQFGKTVTRQDKSAQAKQVSQTTLENAYMEYLRGNTQNGLRQLDKISQQFEHMEGSEQKEQIALFLQKASSQGLVPPETVFDPTNQQEGDLMSITNRVIERFNSFVTDVEDKFTVDHETVKNAQSKFRRNARKTVSGQNVEGGNGLGGNVTTEALQNMLFTIGSQLEKISEDRKQLPSQIKEVLKEARNDLKEEGYNSISLAIKQFEKENFSGMEEKLSDVIKSNDFPEKDNDLSAVMKIARRIKGDVSKAFSELRSLKQEQRQRFAKVESNLAELNTTLNHVKRATDNTQHIQERIEKQLHENPQAVTEKLISMTNNLSGNLQSMDVEETKVSDSEVDQLTKAMGDYVVHLQAYEEEFVNLQDTIITGGNIDVTVLNQGLSELTQNVNALIQQESDFAKRLDNKVENIYNVNIVSLQNAIEKLNEKITAVQFDQQKLGEDVKSALDENRRALSGTTTELEQANKNLQELFGRMTVKLIQEGQRKDDMETISNWFRALEGYQKSLIEQYKPENIKDIVLSGQQKQLEAFQRQLLQDVTDALTHHPALIEANAAYFGRQIENPNNPQLEFYRQTPTDIMRNSTEDIAANMELTETKLDFNAEELGSGQTLVTETDVKFWQKLNETWNEVEMILGSGVDFITLIESGLNNMIGLLRDEIKETLDQSLLETIMNQDIEEKKKILSEFIVQYYKAKGDYPPFVNIASIRPDVINEMRQQVGQFIQS